ncbi:MAG: TRAP transporter substrate-binding protein [Geminicoccaceae bacterium]|nr:TRAP transporter substrate-binding protein [Geminicoccaceae bacterium]
MPMNLPRSLCAAVFAAAVGSAPLCTPVMAQEAHEWDMVTNMARNSYLGKIAMQFAEDVKMATGGTVELEFHEDGEMVPVPEILNAVSTGAVPAAFTWLGFFGGTVPVGKYFAGTPFGPSTEILVSWMWSGGGLAILNKGVEPLGVRVLPCNPMPREGGGYFNKEIDSLDDFDGMKIRMGGWGGEVLQKLGASVISIPGSEIYLALERGRIDATEYSSPLVDESQGYYKLVKYYYFPGWHQSTTWNSFVVNKGYWDQLTEDQRQQIELACRVTVQRSMSDIVPLQIDALERMKADGDFEVREFPEDLIRELYGVWQTVLEENRKQHPLIDEAHQSLQAHIARMEPWFELQTMPAGLN